MNITSALIVDDSKMARVTLKKHLESLGIKVFLAETGEDSLEFLSNNHPDVIFMDCLMPGIDGFETTRRITSNSETASIPVIMCTGKETDEDKHKAMDAGAFSYMTKSSSSGSLKDILADLDMFDAQMSRITSSSAEAVEPKSESPAQTPKPTPTPIAKERFTPSAVDTDALINQTLSAVDKVLNKRLTQITDDFDHLSQQFSTVSSQLEDKIIFSVRSSIKESHHYTDTNSEDLSTRLNNFKLDFDAFKSQIEAIDFDHLVQETVNTHFDQMLTKRRSELAEVIINEELVQTQLNKNIHSELEQTHEELASLKQNIEQQNPSKSPLYAAMVALVCSLGALAASAYLFLK